MHTFMCESIVKLTIWKSLHPSAHVQLFGYVEVVIITSLIASYDKIRWVVD